MKTNLLHVTFDMRIGGTEQVIKNLVENTDKSRFNVSVLCIEEPLGPFGEMLISQGTRIDSFNRKAGFDWALIFKIHKYIRKHRIDVLHCHQYTPWVYGLLGSLGTGTRVIFTEHGRFFPDRSSPKRRFINPLLARLTDQITSISAATKQALVDYEFMSPHRISVIYNGLSPPQSNPRLATELRGQLGIEDSSVVLGTIARLDPIKNHPLLIRAFAEVQKRFSDARLVIVGDGETRQELEKLVDELDVGDSVIFTGYKPEPLGYLEMMDIFLLPSLSEGTSMTLLEAMGLSKPCIVTNVGGNPEIIEHNSTGLVTPSDDLPSLVEACLQLLDDDSQRTRFGKAANDRFQRLFTAENMTARFMELYQKLAS